MSTETDVLVRLAAAARKAHGDAQMASLHLADVKHDFHMADAAARQAQTEFDAADKALREHLFGAAEESEL